MNTKKLSKRLRDRADNIDDRYRDTDDAIPLDKTDARDLAELLRVLARVIEGKTIEKSFGAPGDWGYSHPIRKALAEAPDPSALSA